MGGVGPETAEYDVEDVLAAEENAEGGDGRDVLEETPEFLQDTPDHDRLWFEQRPPQGLRLRRLTAPRSDTGRKSNSTGFRPLTVGRVWAISN